MTGNRTAHPLLISLANLNMDFRMKASNHAFILLTLLPIPKFIHSNKSLLGVLENRLMHDCLDFILKPLKKAAEIGIMMSDPLGNLHYCFTPLAAYIVDTPESALLAGVKGKTSSVTMASHAEFGDSFRHEPRTGSTTLAQLQILESKFHPWDDFEEYVVEAKVNSGFRLSGVHRPFWRNWPLSEPSEFLTSEPLHHWHKLFWDHDVKWCIHIVGNTEIDFRFSVLQPHTGFRHFKEGISALKQVTGREHHDIEWYLIPVIAGAVPREVLTAVRALMDFRYLAQAPKIDDTICTKIEGALDEFHQHKRAIIDAGGRRGKKGIINNFYIPKLEFLQSVVPNIRATGVAIQWTADTTEHAHITEVKGPARTSNNQEYESQICWSLDRTDKCRRFDLATAIREAGVDFWGLDLHTLDASDHDEAPVKITTTSTLLENIDPVSRLVGSARMLVDYFKMAKDLTSGLCPTAPQPFRTFSYSNIALHLTRDPNFKRMSVDEAAIKFQIPDLRGALGDYISRYSNSTYPIGGRHGSPPNCHLPFSLLEIWTHLRLQAKTYYSPHQVLPPNTIHATPPCDKWPLGHHDTVIVNTDPAYEWPRSGIQGNSIPHQLNLI